MTADPTTLLDDALSELRRRLGEVVAAAAMPTEPVEPLGPFMRARREALHLSLAEVAARAGTTKSHVWELEQGRARNPTVLMIYGLSKALQVPFTIMAAAALQQARMTA